MDLGLEGKAVVVTGASRGIGRSIALAFAAEGAHLALCARGADALEATATELRSRGARVHAETCDVGDPGSLEAFLAGSRDRLGGVDILVSNASAFGIADTEESWRSGFEVDLMAGVRAARQVTPWLVDAGGGAIVFISSTAALEAPGGPPYSAVKAALISYSKNLAVQLAPRGVRVNCVAPGSIEFPGGVWESIRNANPQQYAAVLGSIPCGRMGRPEEVADAVVYIASPRASWITGVTLSVDGSQHKGNL